MSESWKINLKLNLPNKKILKEFIINLKDYKISRQIGKGAFGTVNLVTNSAGEKFALKCILPKDNLKEEENKLLFKREVENLAQFDHYALLGFRGFAEMNESLHENYLLTEYCEKGVLDDIFKQEKSSLMPINDNKKFIIVYGIACGLQTLHQRGILHRDIKMENIFLNKDYEPKVADFGLSKEIDKELIFQTEMVGSPLYMAPEIFEKCQYTGAGDVYAFGMLLYIFLTNEMPFTGVFDKYELSLKICKGERPEFPIDLPFYKDLICNCWDQDPKNRPTFTEIMEQLNDDSIIDKLELDFEEIDNYKAKLQSGTFTYNRQERTPRSTKSKVKKQLTIIQKLQIAADSGNADAQIKLAIRLQKGEGIKINLEKAVNYFERAAQNGKVEAMVQYGLCLLEGKGVSKADPTKAAEQFQKAIEISEDPTAMYKYALLLLDGNGVQKDYKKAVHYLKLASEKGSTDAENKYGMILESERHFDAAVEFYRRASIHGNEVGMYNYADLLEKGRYVQQDLKEAARLFRLSYKRGYVPAMVRYGEMLMEGKGGLKKDLNEAKRLFTHALQNGYTSAYVSFGQMFLMGTDDQPRNEVEATINFKKAADAGNVRGMIQYAVSLENGIGCEKNVVKALELYNEAIKRGSNIARTKAAKLLLLGEDGVEEDLETAIEYLSVAAENGDEEAESILNDLNED